MNVRDEFLPAAQELLDEFGAPATLTRSGVADGPLASQKFDRASRTKPSLEQISTTAVIVDPVMTGDTEGARSSKSVAVMLDEPITGDTLTIGAMTYRIGKVSKTAPQGVAIYYEAEVS